MHRTELADYLARAADFQPSRDAIDEVVLAAPFDEPDADPLLSVDVDHYLYGAARRSRR